MAAGKPGRPRENIQTEGQDLLQEKSIHPIVGVKGRSWKKLHPPTGGQFADGGWFWGWLFGGLGASTRLTSDSEASGRNWDAPKFQLHC